MGKGIAVLFKKTFGGVDEILTQGKKKLIWLLYQSCENMFH